MKTKLFIIRKSSISGRGVFAFKNLEKNLELGIAFTRISDSGNADNDYSRTDLGAFVNHSKNSNLILKQKGRKIIYITKRGIRKNEELFLDYEDFPWEGKRDFIKKEACFLNELFNDR